MAIIKKSLFFREIFYIINEYGKNNPWKRFRNL